MCKEYLNLRKKHQKEHDEFPIAYAFNKEQLAEALEKLGAKDISECVTIFNIGDIVKKEDADRYLAMIDRHSKELHEAMLNEEFAEEAFLYEMDNHEYAINYDGDGDVLRCFDMNFDILRKMNLVGAYNRARRRHMKKAEEWF